MLFGHHLVDRTVDEHVRNLAALASDPKTLVFLDTNILSYLYKLHDAARREFFAWSDGLVAAKRLAVPAWVATEYSAKVTSRNLGMYTPKSKEADQVTKLLKGLVEDASLFVDDASLRRLQFAGDRKNFIDDFRKAIEALSPFTRVFSQNFDSGVIHQQIEKHLSPAILESNLVALCARAAEEGDGRFEHRLPPGFRDGEKGENRFGDLIIWYEILAKSLAEVETFPKVLFVTRDEKSDWVYAPKMRMEVVAGDRKAVGNTRPEIKLADPRLVLEFRHATGHSDVVIASLDTLVEGLSKDSPSLFAQLAAAIQINIERAVPMSAASEEVEVPITQPAMGGSDEDAAQAVEVQPDPVQGGVAGDGLADHEHMDIGAFDLQEPVEPAPPRLQYEQAALRDREYQADAPSDINEVIRALKSLNWYTQNPAMLKIRSFRHESFSASAWFVLGRNIYQAACGNSQKAMDFVAGLESQLRQFPEETAQHLLAGMLFEIYFDSRGEFRKAAKFSYADKPLAVATSADFAEAVEFVNYHLRGHEPHLIFRPGERRAMGIQVAWDALIAAPAVNPGHESDPRPTMRGKIRSVTLDGVELMGQEAKEEMEAAHYDLMRTNRLSPERIRDDVSESLAIPQWALNLEIAPELSADVDLLVPRGCRLDPQLALGA